MDARMESMLAARDGEIKALKENLAESEKGRSELRKRVQDLETARVNSTTQSSTLSNGGLRQGPSASGQQNAPPQPGPKLIALMDDRIKLARKSILESTASRIDADTRKQIDEAKTFFEAKVRDIDQGFIEWWTTKEQELEAQWSTQIGSVNERVDVLESLPQGYAAVARNRSSLGSNDPLISSAPPSSTPAATQLSRPTSPASAGPRGPRGRPAVPRVLPLQSSTASPNSRSPIEPKLSVAPLSAPSPSELVSSQQLSASRQKCVKELESHEAKVWKEMKKMQREMHERLVKLEGKSTALVGERGSRHASPVESPAKKNVANEGGGGGERPSKRIKTDAGPSPTKMSEYSKSETVDALGDKVEDLSQTVVALSNALKSAQREIAEVAGLRSSIATVAESLVDAHAGREEILKRMIDGDKSVGRKADLASKQLAQRLDEHVANCGSKIAELEADRAQKGTDQAGESKREVEELKRSLQQYGTDATSLKTELSEFSSRVSSPDRALRLIHDTHD